MTQAAKRTYLIAEKATLENLVATLHEDSVLERMGLEDRLSDVTAELASLQAAPGRTAESELVFHGAPVRGSAGIDARFTSDVISAYQDLIAKTLAAKSELHAMGPIPDAHLSRLHVTDVVHGSFGFHFQELPEQESLGETPLFEAAEEAAHLIDAAGKDDEAFVDVVESLNPRVHDAVRTFFTTIADAGATFRLSTATTTSEFTPDRLRAAVDRVTIESREEADQPAARRVHGRAARLAVVRAQARLRGGDPGKGRPDPRSLEPRRMGPQAVHRPCSSGAMDACRTRTQALHAAAARESIADELSYPEGRAAVARRSTPAGSWSTAKHAEWYPEQRVDRVRVGALGRYRAVEEPEHATNRQRRYPPS
jgi:hypothetical protein